MSESFALDFTKVVANWISEIREGEKLDITHHVPVLLDNDSKHVVSAFFLHYFFLYSLETGYADHFCLCVARSGSAKHWLCAQRWSAVCSVSRQSDVARWNSPCRHASRRVSFLMLLLSKCVLSVLFVRFQQAAFAESEIHCGQA